MSRTGEWAECGRLLSGSHKKGHGGPGREKNSEEKHAGALRVDVSLTGAKELRRDVIAAAAAATAVVATVVLLVAVDFVVSPRLRRKAHGTVNPKHRNAPLDDKLWTVEQFVGTPGGERNP